MSYRRIDPHEKMFLFLTGKGSKERTRKEKAIKFPVKLMYVLECGDYQDIISWTSNGLAFVILDPNIFERIILPDIFKEAKFSSFQRKLKRWKFEKSRGNRGTISSCYYHPQFVQGDFARCMAMTCSSNRSQQSLVSSGTTETTTSTTSNQPSDSLPLIEHATNAVSSNPATSLSSTSRTSDNQQNNSHRGNSAKSIGACPRSTRLNSNTSREIPSLALANGRANRGEGDCDVIRSPVDSIARQQHLPPLSTTGLLRGSGVGADGVTTWRNSHQYQNRPNLTQDAQQFSNIIQSQSILNQSMRNLQPRSYPARDTGVVDRGLIMQQNYVGGRPPSGVTEQLVRTPPESHERFNNSTTNSELDLIRRINTNLQLEQLLLQQRQQEFQNQLILQNAPPSISNAAPGGGVVLRNVSSIDPRTSLLGGNQPNEFSVFSTEERVQLQHRSREELLLLAARNAEPLAERLRSRHSTDSRDQTGLDHLRNPRMF